MSGRLYSTKSKNYDKMFDPTNVKPYGDTINDGKVQLSFTLPIPDGEKAVEAAKQLAKKMGLANPLVIYHSILDNEYTFFVLYGSLTHKVDYTSIHVETIDIRTMSMEEVDEYIEKNIKREIIVAGATTGNDAHTVGIDAIINMKGYAGHYGLERYKMIDAHNLGSQVPNEEFIKRALELKADILLVSQTVTQKDIHIGNLTNLVELLEAEGIRDKIILICGGPRINHEIAKELGYDTGFGPNKYADDVATFMVTEIVKKGINGLGN